MVWKHVHCKWSLDQFCQGINLNPCFFITFYYLPSIIQCLVIHLCASNIEHYTHGVCAIRTFPESHLFDSLATYYKKHVYSCVSTWFRLGDSFVVNYSNLTCCCAESFLTRKTAEQPNKTQAWHAIMLLSSLARYVNTERQKHPIRVLSLA